MRLISMPAKKKDKSEKSAAVAAAASDDVVKKGDKIKVEYTGSFDDGTVFDDSASHGKPLEFEAGAGHVIPGFDNAVIGMKKGEEKIVKITPAEGYGEVNPELVKEVPRDRLPKEQDPKPGMMLVIGLPNGAQLPAKIVSVKEGLVTIDLNHPLAGQTLNFKCKVTEICKP
jgi:FKBP-type peptidyl-prolyl cis-trans isomerase 2